MNLKYSQNFLVNKNTIKNLIKKANVNDNDYIIEIGPGNGALTYELSKNVNKITAIEYDEKLFKNLVNHSSNPDNIEFIYKDFLDYKLPNKGNYKVFSNIPYQITSNIMDKLLNTENLPNEIFLVVQKEAAKKYCGLPFQKYEGLKAIITKYLFDVDIIYDLNRNDFKPTPNVDSVLLHLKRKNGKFSLKEFNDFKDLISYIYNNNQKGNTALERLSLLFTKKQISQFQKKYKINLNDSFTMITFNQWYQIFLFSKIGLSPEKKSKIKGSYKKLKKQQSKLKKQHRTHLRK